MKTKLNRSQFAGSNSSKLFSVPLTSSPNHLAARLDIRFKAILFVLASVLFGAAGAFAQSNNCMKGNALAENIRYFVNGKEVSGLRGNVKEGSDVRVTFTTRKGTNQTRFSLVSYKAPGPTFDPNTADQQKLFEYETGLFKPGNHVMQIQVPNCYFQIDFVKGCVIRNQGPAGSNNFYSAQGRLIDSDNGGTNNCQRLGVDVIIDNPFQVGYPDTTVVHNVAFKNTSRKIKDRINVSVKSAAGWKVEMYNTANVLVARDDNGNGNWEFVNEAFDADMNGQPDTKRLDSDEMEYFDFMVYIPADAEVGYLDTLEVYGFSVIDERVSDMEMAFTEVDEPFVLPVELIYFTARAKGNEVEIAWATATEINNDYFTIERSEDGISFETVSLVKGAGNTNSTTVYKSGDKLPAVAVMYYRLKQTDFDGTTSYSKAVAVKGSGSREKVIAAEGDVFPNPFTQSFSIRFQSAAQGNVTATITDIQGRIISRTMVSAASGHNQFTFENGSSLPKGIYFLTLEQDGSTITSKISKTADY